MENIKEKPLRHEDNWWILVLYLSSRISFSSLSACSLSFFIHLLFADGGESRKVVLEFLSLLPHKANVMSKEGSLARNIRAITVLRDSPHLVR